MSVLNYSQELLLSAMLPALKWFLLKLKASEEDFKSKRTTKPHFVLTIAAPPQSDRAMLTL